MLLERSVAIWQHFSIFAKILQISSMDTVQAQKRILIVDDLREQRLVLIRLLEKFAFALEEATNGQQAVQLWQEWRPDLILMDLRLPIVTGYEATCQIRSLEQAEATHRVSRHQIRPATKIIALTAAYDGTSMLAGVLGFDDFLSKPFRLSELCFKISQQLDLDIRINQLQVPRSSRQAG